MSLNFSKELSQKVFRATSNDYNKMELQNLDLRNIFSINHTPFEMI